jgi:hypothetical protein
MKSVARREIEEEIRRLRHTLGELEAAIASWRRPDRRRGRREKRRGGAFAQFEFSF